MEESENNYTKEIFISCFIVKILYLECCVMKKLLYCLFFVRSNNLNSVNNSLIQIDLASLVQFRKNL